MQRPGNLRGSTIVGGLTYFERRYGRSASHEVVSLLAPQWRPLVKPNTPVLGLLPSRLYPYPFIGELVRTMARVVKRDEDELIREVTTAAVDETLGTVHRLILRWVATPKDYARRAQEVWDQYHDAGRVTVLSVNENEYVVQLSDLPAHDVVVCKICLEGRRRILEKTGVTITDARREKCITWGHDVCVMRYRFKA